MDFYNSPGDAYQMHLLQGCCLEAQRADHTAGCLDTLKSFLPESFHGHMSAVSEEIRNTARLLRDLADRSQVHISRVPVVLNYLNVLLPCLCRTLRDINTYYEDKTMTKEIRWRTMYHKMAQEADGLPLPQRFTLYNHFLTLLGQLLTRSPNFDMNLLEVLQTRILQLREKRGIAPPPAQAGALIPQTMIVTTYQDKNIHWAEDIFSRPLPCRTPLKHSKPSRSFGPFSDPILPPNSKILFRRWFDQDRISVMMVLSSVDEAPYMIVRSYHPATGSPLFAMKGVHELCISREAGAVVLKRWSRTENCGKYWAVLFFITWEEMVLFYCSFVALKCLGDLTFQVSPDEFKLQGEKRLFQARIIDDGFQHSLIVYKDMESRGVRLHAAVWDGELRQCPVWTAFVTHQSQSATWLTRKSKHRVWLKDVQLYVFCKSYRQEHMRHTKTGAFELYFVSEEAAHRFKEVFYPSCSPESSEAYEPGSPMSPMSK